jgi:hypothetical protein
LIAFGGLAGLEESIEEDDNFKVLCRSIIYVIIAVPSITANQRFHKFDRIIGYMPFSVATHSCLMHMHCEAIMFSDDPLPIQTYTI